MSSSMDTDEVKTPSSVLHSSSHALSQLLVTLPCISAKIASVLNASPSLRQSILGIDDTKFTQLTHYRNRDTMERVNLQQLSTLSYDDLQKEYEPLLHNLISRSPPHSVLISMSNHPAEFERIMKVSIPEFIILYSEIEEEIVKPYRSNNKKIFSSPERPLGSVEMFLLWLLAVDGSDSGLVGMAFGGISRTTVSRIVDHVTFAVIECWKLEVSWPDEEERRATYGMLSCCEKAVGIMDGTHCQIEVPKWDEYGFFTGYKKKRTQSYLLVVDAFGMVNYKDGPYKGRGNDLTAFNTTRFLEEKNEFLSEGEIILGDGGFEAEGMIMHEYKKDDLKNAAEKERELMFKFNEEFHKNRALVEHVIGRIKHRVKALSRVYSREVWKQDLLFDAACCFYNRIRRLRIQYALLAK